MNRENNYCVPSRHPNSALLHMKSQSPLNHLTKTWKNWSSGWCGFDVYHRPWSAEQKKRWFNCSPALVALGLAQNAYIHHKQNNINIARRRTCFSTLHPTDRGVWWIQPYLQFIYLRRSPRRAALTLLHHICCCCSCCDISFYFLSLFLWVVVCG